MGRPRTRSKTETKEPSYRKKVVEKWEKWSEDLLKNTGTVAIACVKKGISEYDNSKTFPDDSAKHYSDL